MAGVAALLEEDELSGERTSVRLLEGMEATWDEITETDGALRLERLLAMERRTVRRVLQRGQQAQSDVKRGMVSSAWRFTGRGLFNCVDFKPT